MTPRLFAGAEDREPRGVGAGEGVGRGGAGRGGADRGQLACVDHRRRRAGRGVEEQDDALMREAAGRDIAGEDADDLRAERPLVEAAGHHPEGIVAAEIDDLAQQLLRAALRQRDHRLAHQRDARLIGQPARDLFRADDLHAASSAAAIRRRHQRISRLALRIMITP